jgi:hypothetical protein
MCSGHLAARGRLRGHSRTAAGASSPSPRAPAGAAGPGSGAGSAAVRRRAPSSTSPYWVARLMTERRVYL